MYWSKDGFSVFWGLGTPLGWWLYWLEKLIVHNLPPGSFALPPYLCLFKQILFNLDFNINMIFILMFKLTWLIMVEMVFQTLAQVPTLAACRKGTAREGSQRAGGARGNVQAQRWTDHCQGREGTGDTPTGSGMLPQGPTKPPWLSQVSFCTKCLHKRHGIDAAALNHLKERVCCQFAASYISPCKKQRHTG